MTSGPPVRAAELAAIGLIGVYNVAVTRLPPRHRLLANVGAAVALAGFARVSGVRAAEMGLDRAAVRRGVRVGFAAAVPIAAVAASGVAHPWTRRWLADEKITSTTVREAAFETLIRIPIETAAAEELAFRGVLLALGARNRSRPAAIAAASLLFGLWHVVPTLGSLERGAGGGPGAAASTAAVVAATASAGAGFAWLRIRSDSVIAPTIAHATLNMVAFAGVRATGGNGATG